MSKQKLEYDNQPIFKSLPCKFTQDELISMKNNLVLMIDKFLEIEQEKSETGKNLGAILKDLKDSIKDISKKIKDGFESRPVECYKKLDFTRGMAFIFRFDTTEIIEERPLDETERQQQLSFLNKKADSLIEKEG